MRVDLITNKSRMQIRPFPEQPSADLLRQFIEYDRYQGMFRWKFRRPFIVAPYEEDVARHCRDFNVRFAGRFAFNTNLYGSRAGNIMGRTFRALDVAWALSKGEWPASRVYSLSGDPWDCRPDALTLKEDPLAKRIDRMVDDLYRIKIGSGYHEVQKQGVGKVRLYGEMHRRELAAELEARGIDLDPSLTASLLRSRAYKVIGDDA